MRNILLIACFGLWCCTTDKKETEREKEKQIENAEIQEVKTDDSEFSKYLDLIPNVELPFETNCERCCDHAQIDYDNEVIKRFRPEGTTIVGLVSRTKDRAIILVTYPADMIIPSLKVFDSNGKLTGDMTFMTSYCGGEPGYYGRQFFRINPDLTLSQIDTSYHMTVDSVDYHTLDTTKIEIVKKEYKVNNKGEIVEDNAR